MLACPFNHTDSVYPGHMFEKKVILSAQIHPSYVNWKKFSNGNPKTTAIRDSEAFMKTVQYQQNFMVGRCWLLNKWEITAVTVSKWSFLATTRNKTRLSTTTNKQKNEKKCANSKWQRKKSKKKKEKKRNKRKTDCLCIFSEHTSPKPAALHLRL